VNYLNGRTVIYEVAIVLGPLSPFPNNSPRSAVAGWQLRAIAIAAQIGYSLCAFPFFFASLPPWNSVVTHAKATGYNREGVCVSSVNQQRITWPQAPVQFLLVSALRFQFELSLSDL